MPPGNAGKVRAKRPQVKKKHQKKPSRSSVKRHAKIRLKRRWMILKWLSIMAVWCVLGLAVLVLFYIYDMPDIRKPDFYEQTRQVTLLSSSGKVLTNIGQIHGKFRVYQELPDELVYAVIATEDRRFFQHYGVDVVGVARAAYTNYQAGHIKQGASTITQQLAKILFLSSKRTLRRKVQELLLAFYLEYTYTKEEILALYLNHVYMGAGIYGVDAAATYYFGKDLSDINTTEAAMIAGLLKAPSRYSPVRDKNLSGRRTYQVLLNMVDAGYISEKEMHYALSFPISLNTRFLGNLKHAYFTDWVMDEVRDEVAYTDGDISIQTTLDLQLQEMAEASVEAVLSKYEQERQVSQAAMVVMAPNGLVLAMVGGRSYQKSVFNRAVQARRQPGSAFKLFVYLAALQKGVKPGDMIEDAPIVVDGWSPRNYSGNYMGEVSVRNSLAFSLNSVAVRLIEAVGYQKVVTLARQLGITAPLTPQPSLALGTNEVSLLELTGSYAVIAGGGYAAPPTGVLEITRHDGEGVSTYPVTSQGERILKSFTVMQVDAMLKNVVRYGTAKKAALSVPVAGKTGTSQDFRDAWFIGYTKEYVVGIWLGNDDNTPMNEVSGGSLPVEIWRHFMHGIYDADVKSLFLKKG